MAATGDPIEDWTIPSTADGAQIGTFVVTSVTTTRRRVLFEEGNVYGHAGLEEIAAWT